MLNANSDSTSSISLAKKSIQNKLKQVEAIYLLLLSDKKHQKHHPLALLMKNWHTNKVTEFNAIFNTKYPSFYDNRNISRSGKHDKLEHTYPHTPMGEQALQSGEITKNLDLEIQEFLDSFNKKSVEINPITSKDFELIQNRVKHLEPVTLKKLIKSFTGDKLEDEQIINTLNQKTLLQALLFLNQPMWRTFLNLEDPLSQFARYEFLKILKDVNWHLNNKQPLTNNICLFMLKRLLTLIDSIHRSVYDLKVTSAKENGLIITEIQKLPDLYHADRYISYFYYIQQNPELKALVTDEHLNFSDLLRLRGFNIGVSGVTSKSLYIDAYMNSPYDFFIHDFNHNRRFHSFNWLALIRKLTAENNGVEPELQINGEGKYMSALTYDEHCLPEVKQYVNEQNKALFDEFRANINGIVFPSITGKGSSLEMQQRIDTSGTTLGSPRPKELQDLLQEYPHLIQELDVTSDGLSEKEVKIINNLTRLLYFEILHEFAYTPTEYDISHAFKMVSGAQPFEVMTINGQANFTGSLVTNNNELEAHGNRRLYNGNIASGGAHCQELIEDEKSEQPYVIYVNPFLDNGPNPLSSALNKIMNNFYDNDAMRFKTLGSVKLRRSPVFPYYCMLAAKRIIASFNLNHTLNLSDKDLLDRITDTRYLERYDTGKGKEAIINSVKGKKIFEQMLQRIKQDPEYPELLRQVGDTYGIDLPSYTQKQGKI